MWDYAPLIDMVRPDPHVNEFRYVGMTALEWLVSLRKQNSADYPRALAWFGKRIEIARSKLDRLPRRPSNFYAVELAPIPIVSALSAMVAKLGLRRASAAQWLSTLSGLTAKGIRQEELRHSLLLTMLKRADPEFRLPVRRIQRFISLDHLRPRLMTECAHGFASEAGWRNCCHRLPVRKKRRRGAIGNGRDELQVIRYQHRTFGWSLLRRTRFADLLDDRRDRWLILDEHGKPVHSARADEFDDQQAAMDAAEALMAERFQAWRQHKDSPLWERYSLPGGSGYRELLIQLDDWPFDYQPRHFVTRNVLVHVRTSVRETTCGRRLLYLDEVQSDWHADLHSAARGDSAHQRRKAPPPAPFSKEWPLLAMKLMLWWAQKQRLDGLAWSTVELQRICWGKKGPPESLYGQDLPDAAKQLSRVLPIGSGSTIVRFRDQSRRVERRDIGWIVCGANQSPVTKPFRTREQAERFANLTAGHAAREVPVLWLSALPTIRQIPLFGTGTADIWFGAKEATPQSSKPPEKIPSVVG